MCAMKAKIPCAKRTEDPKSPDQHSAFRQNGTALTGVSTALLTIYDMCKAVDKGMELSGIHLVEKTGGKSGHYIRSEGGYV